MAPGVGMDLSDLREVFARQAPGQTDERRPDTPMHERDLAADEPAHQNFLRLASGARERKDLVTLRMGPPTSSDRFASDGFG